MAERLTMQDERGTAILKETDMKDRCEYCYEAIQKLAHYEDLEEQGRLIELPCKIGDTVYVVEDWGYANGKRKERGYIEELLEAYREFYAATIPILLDTHKAGEQE